jgi:predicted alpha/beta hydrolase family esterase
MTSLVEIEGEPVEVENGKRENARAWFLLSETDPADASLSQSGKPMKYIGLDQSLAVVEKELGLCRDEELVCVLGFSQGGVFVHILSRLAEIMPESFGRIQAAIVASGFAGQHCSDETDKYHVGRMPDRDKLSMPSLHIIGEKDTSVRPELSFDLVSIYDKSEVLLHEKGHIIPQQSAYCAKAIAFLDEIASDKVAKSQI